MKIFIKFSLLFLALILSGCAGTGSKNYDEVSKQIVSSSNSGKVFLYRDDSHFGGAIGMKVILNGNQVAELGLGEMVMLDPINGKNSLQIKSTSLMSDSDIVQFESDRKTSRFFLANVQMGLLRSRVRLNETVESSWRSEAGRR